MPIFGGESDSSNSPSWVPKNEFSKIDLGFLYQIPLKVINEKLSWKTEFLGQYSFNHLFGPEQFYIGGQNSVRGFVDNSLYGDDGYYWRNELEYYFTLQFGSELIFVNCFGGYDFGWVNSNVDNSYTGSLSGIAGGISFFWKGLSIELFQSRPITILSDMQREGTQTWLRLSYNI